jgi:hypothetical protein
MPARIWKQPLSPTLSPRKSGEREKTTARIRIDLSRQLVLAPGTQALFRFELRHAKQMGEHLEPVALGQLDQFGNSFGNEGHGLIGAAFLTSFGHFGWRVRFLA